MCELMGLSVERRISASFSFKEFAGRDRLNLDGWGLAWYPDKAAALIKEPIPWSTSPQAEFLETYHDLLSCIYLAHVRHKTVGGKPTHADTHPFVRECQGREYCFAHNGTLKDLPELSALARYRPVGDTDSEHAFCVLLERVFKRGRLHSHDDFMWLHHELSSLNELGKLNCLLSDGESLCCYHDGAGHKSLAWCKLEVPAHRAEQFKDRDLEFALESGRSTEALLVATQPMGEGQWRQFHPGELIVARKGRVEFSSRKETAALISSRT